MGPGPYIIQRGITVLGRVEQLSPGRAVDWQEGDLIPTPDWADVAPLFAVESEALKHADRWPEAWDEAYAAAQGPGISIIDADGKHWTVDVHVEGMLIRVRLR